MTVILFYHCMETTSIAAEFLVKVVRGGGKAKRYQRPAGQ
jgi:hypothetical protein